MIAICRDKNSGKICRLVELSDKRYIQEQLDKFGLNNGDYNIEYFIGDVEHDSNS